jgi:hypothetical protein
MKAIQPQVGSKLDISCAATPKALRYQAVLYSEGGEHSKSLFSIVEEARNWVLKQYAGFYRAGDAAAAVYDLQNDRRRVFATDDPRGFLPQR